MTTKKKCNFSVRVRREGSDGQLFSELVRLDVDGKPIQGNAVVIDRVKGTQFNAKTVVFRAERLADILGVKIDIDYEWPCIALKKLMCRCPRCIGAGVA